MGKYFNGAVDVSVKVYEAKNAEAKPNASNGRIFQMLGSPVAEIKLGDEILFSRVSGMLGMSYKDKDAFDRGDGSIVVSYTNAYRGDSGSFDKVTPSEKMEAILKAETIKAFNEGFATSERDLHDADNAEMDADEYIALSQAAIAKAAKMKTKLAESSTSAQANLEQLDKELDAELE